jgi:maltooligosyltrehalose synthase
LQPFDLAQAAVLFLAPLVRHSLENRHDRKQLAGSRLRLFLQQLKSSQEPRHISATNRMLRHLRPAAGDKDVISHVPQLTQEGVRRKFQEITAPVMAKSAEDTMFYRYSRFIALNEVGGDPGRFGIDAEEFHKHFLQRARNWPHTMLATSTHDAKRAEDARARLLALTGTAEEWHGMLTDWPDSFGKHSKLDRRELYFLRSR